MALPPEIIRMLVAGLLADSSPADRTLHLLSFCGVCSRWREVARETREGLAFDGSADNAAANHAKATLPRFRKAGVSQKRDACLGAARLLTGYPALTVSGEAATDDVLRSVAAANGGQLTSLRVLGAHAVSDAGLCALIAASPRLEALVLEDAGPRVTGAFLPVLLQSCPQLEALTVEGADGIDWRMLRHQPVCWAATPAAQQQQQQPAGGGAAGTSTLSRAVWAAQGRGGAAAVQAQQAGGAGSSTSRDSPQSHAQQAVQQQQQPSSSPLVEADLLRHSRRLSSSSGGGIIAGGGCAEPGSAVDDHDGGTNSRSSLSGSSDDASTSISVPAQAVSALTIQLRDTSLGADGAPAAASRLAASSSGSGGSSSSAGARGGGGGSERAHAALRRLRVRFANADGLQPALEVLPGLTDLSLDGPSSVVQAASLLCPGLQRLAYLVGSPAELDGALLCLGAMRALRSLELEVRGMVLTSEQLRAVGALPLRELALDSHAFRQHPSMPRPQYSHLDNEGVKALVDAICGRMRTELMPLRLSLCGATALKQEAVSALLRLPLLASIDTGGCVKLTPMDRMRLVAKVKAGQGMLDAKGCLAGASSSGGAGSSLAALRLPHVL